MVNFIPFNTPAGVVWIQVDLVDGVSVVNAFQDTAFDSFEEAAAAMTSNAKLIRNMLVNLQPTSVEITFGMKAGLNPGLVGDQQKRIFALAGNRDNANYWVKVKWEEKKNAS